MGMDGESNESQEQLPLWPERITGGKYVRMLQAHVRTLRERASGEAP